MSGEMLGGVRGGEEWWHVRWSARWRGVVAC